MEVASQRETTNAASTEPATACSDELLVGFADPLAAYSAYITAANERKWCRAVNTFVVEARPELATITFKTLAVVASAANPKQAAYREQLIALCAKYHLSCASEDHFIELAVNALNGLSISDAEPRLPKITSDVPEDVYRDVMEAMTAADAESIGTFEPTLYDFAQVGDRATGVSRQTNGRSLPVTFTKGASGWMLALR